MRIKRWQQITIAFSLAWMVGGGAYEWSASTTRAHSRALAEYESCIEISLLAHSSATGLCSQRASRTLAAGLQGTWRDAAVVALAPVVIPWIAIGLLLTIRRIAAKGV